MDVPILLYVLSFVGPGELADSRPMVANTRTMVGNKLFSFPLLRCMKKGVHYQLMRQGNWLPRVLDLLSASLLVCCFIVCAEMIAM